MSRVMDTQAVINQELFFCKNPNVVSRTILDETILVPICGRLADMQNIFSLDTVSAFIWKHLDGRSSLGEIHQRILEEFIVDPIQAENDLAEFIDELIKAGLIMTSQVKL